MVLSCSWNSLVQNLGKSGHIVAFPMQILYSNFPLRWNTGGGPTRHYKPQVASVVVLQGSRLLLADWQLGNNPDYYEHRLEDPTNPIHTCKTLTTYDPNMWVSDIDSQGYKYRPCTCGIRQFLSASVQCMCMDYCLRAPHPTTKSPGLWWPQELHQ